MEDEMQKFKSDLRQRCFIFGRDMLLFADTLPNKRIGWVIGDQLARSATSIGANLFEARGAGSRKEYKKYFEISLRSANETGYWLQLLTATGIMEKGRANKFNAELTEIIKILTTSILTLKKHINL